MLLIKQVTAKTPTTPALFTVLMTTASSPADVALAVEAGPAEVASLLITRGFTASTVLAAMGRATERGEAKLGEVEPIEVTLPHPDDVQVASRWTAVNTFRAAFMRAVMARDAVQDEAEAEADRCETAAVRVAPDAAERVCLSAEVWLLRRAREVERHGRWWG